MPTYTFVCKYVVDIEAEDEDEAYDFAYSSMSPDVTDGYNQEATMVRSY